MNIRTMPFKWLAAMGLLVAPQISMAVGWSSSVNITVVDAEGLYGATYLYLSFSEHPIATSCSNDTTNYWLLGGSPENKKNMMAVATAARLADRPVKILFDDSYSGASSCSGGGTAGYPVATGIMML